MSQDKLGKLNGEELVDQLQAHLAECNKMVSLLKKKTSLDPEELRKIKNNLMFTRTKVRGLSKSLQEMKKPINSFKMSL